MPYSKSTQKKYGENPLKKKTPVYKKSSGFKMRPMPKRAPSAAVQTMMKSLTPQLPKIHKQKLAGRVRQYNV